MEVRNVQDSACSHMSGLLEPIVIADLDILLTALSVELGNRIIPGRGFARRGPDGRPEVTDAELACIAVVQMLLPAGL